MLVAQAVYAYEYPVDCVLMYIESGKNEVIIYNKRPGFERINLYLEGLHRPVLTGNGQNVLSYKALLNEFSLKDIKKKYTRLCYDQRLYFDVFVFWQGAGGQRINYCTIESFMYSDEYTEAGDPNGTEEDENQDDYEWDFLDETAQQQISIQPALYLLLLSDDYYIDKTRFMDKANQK
jgi:hypothetical protein